MSSISYNKLFASYNQKGISNVLINAKAYVITQPVNSDNLQIANTEYVKNETSGLKTLISNKFEEALNAINNVKYIHITENNLNASNSYYILNNSNIVVEVVCNIYLPISLIEGKIINIINLSSSYININTQDNELMYSSLYLNPAGSSTFQSPQNKLLKFFNVKSKNLFSWVIIS